MFGVPDFGEKISEMIAAINDCSRQNFLHADITSYEGMLKDLQRLNRYYNQHFVNSPTQYAQCVEQVMEGVVSKAETIMHHLTNNRDGIFNWRLDNPHNDEELSNSNPRMYKAWNDAKMAANNHKIKIGSVHRLIDSFNGDQNNMQLCRNI